ncbi:MAG: YlmC/YmxH family sporulation protein [Eubacteriales bacterium]|nr:YlmC/YmxH family sporulation protein [Eubacteriales bacterium]MDD4582948.1 YlmC/YmxH family sporulation protein [Eubacteriales bacterium]
MRLSEFGEKEIVNITNGCRYGDLIDAELLFEERTAKIRAILVPEYKGRLFFSGNINFIQMPWDSIKKIGEDIIIVETEL